MRLLLRAGIVLGLAAAACKDSPGPVDFTDPVAVTNDLQAVDSAFNTPAFHSFSAVTTEFGPAATGAAPLAPLLGATLPKLDRSIARASILSALRARQLQQLGPQMSAAAAQGQIIPDSLYGRVFEWDASLLAYTWQSGTVTGLNGVRFILYQVDEFGAFVQPLTAVGYVDLIDESTFSTLQLHILVKGVGGTTTYVDYTATIHATASSVSANVTGYITNGLTAGANKTLTFDETFSATETRISGNATFTLNNPARTLTMYEAATFSGNSLILDADFRITRPGETVQFAARITITFNPDDSITTTVNAAVRVNGRTVATLRGDPTDPGTQWVDAGGEPLTAEDLAALEGLEDAAAQFQEAVANMFLPIETFFGA